MNSMHIEMRSISFGFIEEIHKVSDENKTRKYYNVIFSNSINS